MKGLSSATLALMREEPLVLKNHMDFVYRQIAKIEGILKTSKKSAHCQPEAKNLGLKINTTARGDR